MSGTVTMGALIKRINRRLAHVHARLGTRDDGAAPYIVNGRNWVEELGRELGVLKPTETVK